MTVKNKDIAIFKTQNNMTLPDIWNLMRSCSNHKLLYQNVMSDMSMLRQFASEVESSRWISFNNATEWYPLACALLSHCKEVKLIDVAEILHRIKYIPAIDIHDDIFLQNFNEKIFDGYHWRSLIDEFSNNIYIISVAMVLNTKFDDEGFLLSLDATKINASIVEQFSEKWEPVFGQKTRQKQRIRAVR